MRFSAITTLCAAPLALAGSLDMSLVNRRTEKGESIVVSNSAALSINTNLAAGQVNVLREGAVEVLAVSEVDIIVLEYSSGGSAGTTTMNTPQTVATGTPQIHTVVVGGAAGLAYVPDTIEANVGDMVQFQFMSANHTATQSAFTTPCEKLANGTGFDSGFMPNANNSVVPPPMSMFQVNVATPLWFYCRQTGHCGKGMTFSINPTATKTQAMFQQMAVAQNGTGSTAGIIAGSSAAASVAAPASTGSSSTGTESSGTGSSSTGTESSGSSTSSTGTGVSSGTGASTGMTSGQGTTADDGTCTCSCLCGVADFPLAVQGLAAFGGISGAMPLAALEA